MPDLHTAQQVSEHDHRKTFVRVHILGTLRVSGPNGVLIPVPRRAHSLIGLIAAAGPDGISRESLADELWAQDRPDTWMSALRNRTTAARKSLGQNSLMNLNGHYRFGPNVQVDSWDIIAHKIDGGDLTNELWFLGGEPLADIADSPLRAAHARDVHQARVTLIHATVHRGQPLSAHALQSLRIYQQMHPDDVPVAAATVQAHIYAGQPDRAAAVFADVKASAATSPQLKDLIPRLEQLLEASHGHPLFTGAASPNTLDRRAVLFRRAAGDENWGLALEIAMEGLPEAERSSGDPERLALLEAIPPDKLEGSRRFALVLALSRHLLYAGREAEAQQWAKSSRELARSANDHLLSIITCATVGDSDDERTPMVLPESFQTAPAANISLRSLQVVVTHHLERNSFEGATALFERFQTLVEANAHPYRRWHLLLLQSMRFFVGGDLQAAKEAAHGAHEFGQLLGVADAETALAGQLSNPQLIDPRQVEARDYFTEFPNAVDSTLIQALHAVAQTRQEGNLAVDQFVRDFNYESRSALAFPVVALVAPHVVDPSLRSKLIQRMRHRTGTSAIWPSGSLHLGPVDRTLAQLIHDPDEVRSLLIDAVHVADIQQTRLWQVVCRLDLAAATGNQQLRHDASALATTPDLCRVVADYGPMPPVVTD